MPEIPSRYETWPTAAHVQSMLNSAGFWPTAMAAAELAAEQAEIALAAAVDEFAGSTGWHPLLSTGDVNETRAYNALSPRGVLLLDAGLLQLTAVTLLGRSVPLNEGVFARPANAVGDMPFTQLEFASALCGGRRWPVPNAIVVTGEWGRFRTVPRDIWNAVLRMAAVGALSAIEQPRPLAARAEDGFSEQYDIVGAIQPRNVLGVWPREFERLVARYRRVGVG